MSSVPELTHWTPKYRTNTDPGANATGAIAASAPSTTSPIPCCTRASDRCRTDPRHFLLCLACSSRRIAREVGVHIRKRRSMKAGRNAALSYEMQRQAEGTVEADELYHTAGHKGQAQHGGKKHWDAGHVVAARSANLVEAILDKDRLRYCAGQLAGSVVIQATKDFTVQTVQKAANSPSKRAVGSIPVPPAAIGR